MESIKKKPKLDQFKEFYRHYLNIMAKLCRVAEQVAVVKKAREIRKKYTDDQRSWDLPIGEQCILRRAARALEPYGYDNTRDGTAQAIAHLEADMLVYQKIEESLASSLKGQIRHLFGQDELELWWDERLDRLSQTASDDIAELYGVAVARARFFVNYLRENAGDETISTFAPSVIEESFLISEQGLFYSLKN